MKSLKSRIEREVMIGLTVEQQQALEIATTFEGSKPSQYGRVAIVQRLVKEGFLAHPAQRFIDQAKAAK